MRAERSSASTPCTWPRTRRSTSGRSAPTSCSARRYKFLGPHCGVLAADPDLLQTLHPDKLAPSSDAVPERFEYGTLPYELLAGVTAAVEVIASLAPSAAAGRASVPEEGVHAGGSGSVRRVRIAAAMEAVEAHEDALREELEAGLAPLPGTAQRARAALRTPTLLLTFEHRDPADVAAALAARGINAPAGSFYALEASRRLGLGDTGGVRIGLAPYSDADDVGRLLGALREILAS